MSGNMFAKRFQPFSSVPSERQVRRYVNGCTSGVDDAQPEGPIGYDVLLVIKELHRGRRSGRISSQAKFG